jgi:hypothetical protein
MLAARYSFQSSTENCHTPDSTCQTRKSDCHTPYRSDIARNHRMDTQGNSPVNGGRNSGRALWQCASPPAFRGKTVSSGKSRPATSGSRNMSSIPSHFTGYQKCGFADGLAVQVNQIPRYSLPKFRTCSNMVATPYLKNLPNPRHFTSPIPDDD